MNKTAQKWIYTGKDGVKEEVTLERWMWAVLYKPTEAQIAVAKEATIQQVAADAQAKLADLKIEKDRMPADADKAVKVSLERRIVDQQIRVQVPVEPIGTQLHQFDNNGVFHRIDEIDTEKVALWTLYQPNGDGRIDFIVPEGAKLIHKYRNVKPYYLKDFVRVYMFGYKLKGQTSHYNFILPNDIVIQSSFDNVDLTKFLGTKK